MCFVKNCQILKKIPPRGPLPRPWNQKSTLPRLFGLTTAFQNGMTQPGSTNNQGPAPLQGKGKGAGQGLPGNLGELGGSTTHPKVTADPPSKPWKFCSNPFTCLKDIHNFLYHGCTDGHTNSIQNESPFYPIWMQAKIKFLPCFFYLSQNGVWINKKVVENWPIWKKLQPTCRFKIVTKIVVQFSVLASQEVKWHCSLRQKDCKEADKSFENFKNNFFHLILNLRLELTELS